jgi:uncharacterized protein YacL
VRRLTGARAAANVLLVALAVFHVLVMLRVLPASAVWGGQASGSPGDLMALEMVGLVVTLLFALIVAAKIGYVRAPRLRRVIGICTWVVFGYFVLNILGNLASASPLEKMIFTPFSVVVSALALRVAIEK